MTQQQIPPPVIEPLAVDQRVAAQMLGVCGRTVHSLQQRGELASFTSGRRRLYPVSGLREFVAARVAANAAASVVKAAKP